MLECSLRKDLEVTILVAFGTETQGLAAILAHLNAKVEIGEDVLDQNFSPEDHLFILRLTLLIRMHEIALLLESELAFGGGLPG